MSRLHLHRISACTPRILGTWLQALGLLRLTAEQADANARGWWEGTSFVLATTLDEDELLTFFLHRYAPTPILAPWNAGSGFYPKDRAEALRALEASPAARFEPLSRAAAVARAALGERREAAKEESKFALCRHLLTAWTGPAAEWARAAFVCGDDGKPAWPSLLGTGGNDGRLDFTNNFHLHLTTLFEAATGEPRPESSGLLRAALLESPRAGATRAASVGQFHPAGAGGANSSTGFDTGASCNPWAFVLLLEGTIVLQGAASARLDSEGRPLAAAPFAIRPHPIGNGSATAGEKSLRGEQWLPTWKAPALYPEVRQLLREGRCRIEGRQAQQPLDFARALGRLGVARGVARFERFGYLERNGQANLAVHLGEWAPGTARHQDLVDEVAGWGSLLARRTREGPGRLQRLARVLQERLLRVTRPEATGADWQAVLTEVGRLERAMVDNPGFTAKSGLVPVRLQGAGWWEAPCTDEAEWRLAAALARVRETATDRAPRSLRARWLPLDPKSGSRRFAADESGLRRSPEMAGRGQDPLVDLLAILHRLVAGTREAMTLRGAGLHADPSDLAALIAGRVDLRRVLALALPLMAVQSAPPASSSPAEAFSVPAWWALLRLGWGLDPLTLGAPGEAWRGRRHDARLFARLRRGDGAGAVRLAAHRLVLQGLSPKLESAHVSGAAVHRAAAALIFPLDDRVKSELARRCLRVPMVSPVSRGVSE